jgi:hypothetical protein
VFGKTGSGKTAAVLYLVFQAFQNVVFYDGKRREHEALAVPVLEQIEHVEQALLADDPDDRLDRFCYRPRDPNPDDWNRVCRAVYEAGDTHLIGDELKRVYQQDSGIAPITEAHNDLLTTGRDKGCGTTAISQRPKRIPLEAISEATHLLSFQLKTQTDRERIGEVIGREHAKRLRKLDQYQYLYDHDHLPEPEINDPLPI